jgi:hypothetical protein
MSRRILLTLFFFSTLATSILSQSLGIEKFGVDFQFLPEDLGGATRIPRHWLTSRHSYDFPRQDSTLSMARWQSGDFGLSDINVMFSPWSTRGRWLLAGQWLTYEGYSQLKRNDFFAGYKRDQHTLTLSVVNTKPRIYEPAYNRFTGWDSRTQRMDWHMEKTGGSFDIETILTGKYSRFKPDRGDSLLTGGTQYAELVGEITLLQDWWSVTLKGEWYEAWPGKDHYLFSQLNLNPVLQHPLGEIGFTVSKNNEEIFCYEGWIAFSKWGMSAKISTESRFYPAVLVTRYGADMEADFLSVRFSLKKNMGDLIHMQIKHGWSRRLNETYYLRFLRNTQTMDAARYDPALFMHGEGNIEIGRAFFMADLSWDYRDFNGIEYLWYHPGMINVKPGIQAGSTFFRNLELLFRVEGLFQIHENPENVWFEPALPGFIPIAGTGDPSLQSDLTLNGKITARVKTFTLSAGIDNILQREVYTAHNLMPNTRMFILDIQWLWYQ